MDRKLLIFLGLIFFAGQPGVVQGSEIPACRLIPLLNQCFDNTQDIPVYVGKNVNSFGTNFRFCLAFDTIRTKSKPLRLIFMLDQSGSMCRDGGCTGTLKNDTLDMRIAATKTFLDSLKRQQPNSQVGIIRFDDFYLLRGVMAPVTLTDANVIALKAEADKASCRTIFGKAAATETTKLTYIGLSLDSALKLVDLNYSTIAMTHDRHIIILTDGEWGDTNRLPARLLENYRSTYPTRVVPSIHGIFISDSASHVQNGFPPAGAATCGPADTTYIDTQYLKFAVENTGGFYIAGTTAASIIPQTQMLATKILSPLTQITAPQPEILQSIKFINQSNGQLFSGVITKDETGVNDYLVTTQPLPLDFGENVYTIQKTLTTIHGDTVCNQVLTINRSLTDTAALLSGTGFTFSCNPDSAVNVVRPIHFKKVGLVTIQVYNCNGRKVSEYSKISQAILNDFSAQAGSLPRGVYVVRYAGVGLQIVNKIVLLGKN